MAEITITICHNQRIKTRDVLSMVKQALPEGFSCKLEKAIHGYTKIDVLDGLAFSVKTAAGGVISITEMNNG